MASTVRNAEDADPAMDGDVRGAGTGASPSRCGVDAHLRAKSRLLLAAIAALALAGCAGFDGYPKRATDPDTDLQTLAPYIDANAVAACLTAPTTECRNRIVGARMYAADVRFSEFEETLFRQTRTAGFGATLGSLGLTTAAAASSGGAAQVLAGISAFIIGGREAFQKEVLAERTVVAIHTAMRSRRAEIALRLRSGLAQPIVQYPFEGALSDLDAYYNAGTVLGALVGITESVGASAQKAEAQLREAFSFKPDEAARKLELVICGGTANCSALNAAAAKRMQERCWSKSGVKPDTPMLDFMLQEKFARERAAVAQCLEL